MKKVYNKPSNSVPVKQEKKKPTLTFYLVCLLILVILAGSVLGAFAFVENKMTVGHAEEPTLNILPVENYLEPYYLRSASYGVPQYVDNGVLHWFSLVESTQFYTFANFDLFYPNLSFNQPFTFYVFVPSAFSRIARIFLYASSPISTMVHEFNGYNSGKGDLFVLQSGNSTVNYSLRFKTDVSFVGNTYNFYFVCCGFYGEFSYEDLVQSAGYALGLGNGYLNGYSDGNSNGYNEGYQLGLQDSPKYSGFFAGGRMGFNFNDSLDFNGSLYSLNDFVYIPRFDLPDNVYFPYFGGFYFVTENLIEYLETDSAFSSLRAKPGGNVSTVDIVIDFVDSPILINSDNSVFLLLSIYNSNTYFKSTMNFGSGIIFKFSSGKIYKVLGWELDTGNGDRSLFNSLSLSDFIGDSIVRIDFVSNRIEDYPIVTMNQNSSYLTSYNNGFRDGKLVGYDNGFDYGFAQGEESGKIKGIAQANEYSFFGLLASVVDAPVQALTGLLSFDILGVNMSNFFFGLLTLAFIIMVVKLII